MRVPSTAQTTFHPPPPLQILNTPLPSVCRTGGSVKKVEARFMQFSLYTVQ